MLTRPLFTGLALLLFLMPFGGAVGLLLKTEQELIHFTERELEGLRILRSRFRDYGEAVRSSSPEAETVRREMIDTGLSSNLILDPEKRSYYLALILIHSLPTALASGEALLTHAHPLDEGRLSMAEEQLQEALALLGPDNAVEHTEVMRVLSLLRDRSHAADGGEAGHSQLRHRMVSAFLELHAQASDALEHHLVRRLAKWHREERTIIAYAGLTFLGVVAAFLLFSRNLVRREVLEKAREVKAILETVTDGVITIDESGIVEGFTPSAERMFGYKAAEVVGRNVSMLMPQPHARQHDQYIRNYISTGDAKIIGIGREVVARHRSGTEFPMELNISDFTIAGKRMFVGTVRDITARREAEARHNEALEQLRHANIMAEVARQELERSLQLAQDSNRAKSDFLANMSHELRTPMNGVLGMAHLLSETPLTPEQQQFVSTITGSASSLLALLNDVLDISKIEAGALELEYIPYSLHAVIKDTTGLLQPQAASKGILLGYELKGEVPRNIWGDPGRMRQVLINLLSNAVKFTEVGHVLLQIIAEPSELGIGQLNIMVHDTGIGIPESKLSGIFDKFTQADTSVTRRYGGTGLGLAISRQLVSMMGGNVKVSSTEGKGSCFSFTIPFTEASEDELTRFGGEKKDVSQGVLYCHRKPVKQARALLVEDYHVNQLFARKLLANLGLTQLDLAENGLEAVALYRDNEYDIVFMDCQMPEMDGYLATEHIRKMENEKGRYTPVIAMTANAMIGDREKCLRSGMDDYLSKPIDIQQLRDVLNQWLDLEAEGTV